MQEVLARKGKECSVCGCTNTDFKNTFMFGCADCYREMREMALTAAEGAQKAVYHCGKTPFSYKTDKIVQNQSKDVNGFYKSGEHGFGFRTAKMRVGNNADASLLSTVEGETDASHVSTFEGETAASLLRAAEAEGCSPEEARSVTDFNVMSSRVRLARNIEGLPFPKAGKAASPEALLQLTLGAANCAKNEFDSDLYLMSELSKAQKTALVERHIISLPLANNSATGAVIIERGEENVSVMLNEEDHVREQCVCEGFSLDKAYRKIDAYDDALIQALPVAYDEQLGFLTACPTNLGTGMRASVMLFLPALKLAGAIEDALERFTKELGLTIRGVYGEGSEAAGDMYQLSNARTLGVDERGITDYVARAALKMCIFERKACQKLAVEQGDKLLDKVMRSYGVLKSAYSLSSGELMELISDVKLGVILGVVPLKDTKPLDKLVQLCSAASLSLKTGERTPRERDIIRATLVRNILKEEQ
jgi:protein arginine kinase